MEYKIKKQDHLKVCILIVSFLTVMILLHLKIENFIFCFEGALIAMFFMCILLFSDDYLNPFIFFFIYSFLGYLDILFVVLKVRIVDSVYPISIYNKSLFIIILWFVFFTIGYYFFKKKRKRINAQKDKSENSIVKKNIDLNIEPNIALFLITFIVAFVIFKIYKSTSSIGGIINAFFNPNFKLFLEQNYLSMFMALCGIIPVLFLDKKKKVTSIISLVLVFILMSLTKRRALTLVYTLVPILTYYNYKIRKIRLKDLAILFIPLMIFVLIIGNIRGVNSGTSETVNNYFVENLSELTRQVEYGKNIPDLLYSMDTGAVEKQHFKYIFNGIITYVPRAIWKDKPMVESATIVTALVYHNSRHVAGHPVGPYGWAYLLFGYSGVIILGFFTGLIVSRFYKLILKKNNLFYYLIYSYSIVKMLEIVTPEAQFKVSFFILCLFGLAFASKILKKKKYNKGNSNEK